jgi:hypothetical protein
MCSTNVVFTAGMPHAGFTLINGTSLAGGLNHQLQLEQQQLPLTTVWDIFQQQLQLEQQQLPPTTVWDIFQQQLQLEQQQLPPTTVWDIFQQHQLIGTPLYTVRKGKCYLDDTYCIENMVRVFTHFFSIPGFKLN